MYNLFWGLQLILHATEKSCNRPVYFRDDLPSLKLTCSPLKIDGWNTTFLLGTTSPQKVAKEGKSPYFREI